MAVDPNSQIWDEDRVVALQAVAGNSIGVDLTFHFVRNEFQAVTRQ